MKDQLKAIIIAFLSFLVAIGVILGSGVALAYGEDEDEHGEAKADAAETAVTFSSSPRFPVAGQPAELSFMVFHHGIAEEGLTLTVVLVPVETGHEHGGAPDQHDDEVADEHPHDEVDEHGHNDEPADEHPHDEADEELEAIKIIPAEIAPGVYVANYTFDNGGRYLVAVQTGNEPKEFEVAVRSGPVAWPFLIGLAGVSVFLAGMVAVVKITRKEW